MTTAVTGELIATRNAGAFTHLTFVAPGVGELARPGQLVSVAVGDASTALVARRTLPLRSVTPSGTYGGTAEVVVDAARDPGERWLADRRVHDEVQLIGPLGRPFPLPEQPLPCLLVGVDAAAAPLTWLARSLRDRGCQVDLIIAGSDDRHLLDVIEARRLVGNVTVVTPGVATAGPVGEPQHAGRVGEPPRASRIETSEVDLRGLDTADHFVPAYSTGGGGAYATGGGGAYATGGGGASATGGGGAYATGGGGAYSSGALGQALRAAVREGVRRQDSAIVYGSAGARELAAIVPLVDGMGVVSQVAIHEAMPCGTGLCSACLVPVRGRDRAVRSIRACSDGPVVRGARVVWDQYLEGLGEVVS
jgi:NAD(P)H-flavin reductase